MTRINQRKPTIAPNLASVAIELGDELDIERRFNDALWKVAFGQRYGASAEGLMLAAGIKTVWALERELRRERRQRRSLWEPGEREARGGEIVASLARDWYFHALVKIETDRIAFEGFEYSSLSEEHREIIRNIAGDDTCTTLD